YIATSTAKNAPSRAYLRAVAETVGAFWEGSGGTITEADITVRNNPAANPPNPQTETPAFRRWFGKSVVVDADGKPLRVYHGTYGNFEVFDRFFMRSRGRESLDQVGSWFSTEPGKTGAGMYISDTVEGANIVPVYLSIQHPWNVTFRGLWRAAQRMSGQDENARPNAASVQALDDWMDAVGIDGIHIRPDPRNGTEFAGQDVWVARRPTQIKSAIGNRGTFDPEDPSIVRNPRRKNPEDAAAPLVLYHGAQRWEGPPSIVAHRKGHAEHGAGIYLTTSWERAASYAKGGGSVYRFEMSPDMRWLEDARLPAADTVRWVKSLPRLKRKADIVASLERTAGRVGPSIPAEGLVAAFVNFGASAGQHGTSLAEYLVAHGIDASHVQPTMNEDWVVVFNPAKVLRVTRLAAKDTGEGFAWDLPRVRRNPEDAPARIRLQGFSTTRVIPPAVEAFLHDLFEASYPNPLSDDTSSR
ncbi:MAG: hypothetical protein EBS48_10745, partial [Actinobacteria bacterium]|nr:hypothetical protein [Actinomycetota bacterium]